MRIYWLFVGTNNWTNNWLFYFQVYRVFFTLIHEVAISILNKSVNKIDLECFSNKLAFFLNNLVVKVQNAVVSSLAHWKASFVTVFFVLGLDS